MKNESSKLSRKSLMALIAAAGALGTVLEPKRSFARQGSKRTFNWPTINTPGEAGSDLSAIANQIANGSKAHTHAGGPPHFCTLKDLANGLRQIANEIDRNHGANGWGDPPGGGSCSMHKK